MAVKERALGDSAPSRVAPPSPILQMTITQQPRGAALSSGYHWTAMPMGQSGVGLPKSRLVVNRGLLLAFLTLLESGIELPGTYPLEQRVIGGPRHKVALTGSLFWVS